MHYKCASTPPKQAYSSSIRYTLVARYRTEVYIDLEMLVRIILQFQYQIIGLV